jgi:hypothetical protein
MIMTLERQIVEIPENQISTKRGLPVYRTNPSVPQAFNLPTRTKRINVPGGKGSVIVDNTTGELKGIGGLGFWFEEEVDTTRFVKLFLDGIKQAAGLSKTGIQVFELVYNEMRANPGRDEIKLNQYVAKDHGISRAVDFRPREECLDDIGDASGGGLRRLRSLDGQLVEFLLGGLAVGPALRQTDSLAGDGDHPPANVFAEPDFVGTRHTIPPVKGALKKRLDRKVWHPRPSADFFQRGPEFSTEFSTEPWLTDTGTAVSPCSA